jgi:hypothetical protein
MNALQEYILKNFQRKRDAVEFIHQKTGVPTGTIYAHLYGQRNIGHKSGLAYQSLLKIPLEEIVSPPK